MDTGWLDLSKSSRALYSDMYSIWIQGFEKSSSAAGQLVDKGGITFCIMPRTDNCH